MRFISMILCAFVAFAAAGCEKAGYEEIHEGRTATVYACGSWDADQIDQMQAAVSDWNAKAGPRFGRDVFSFGGVLVDKTTIDSDSTGDGVHCIYQLWPSRSPLTAYGQSLWDGHHEDEDDGATFVDNDDIVVYIELETPTLPGNYHWAMQSTFGHELGHGAGLGHTDEDAAFDSVMKERRSATHVQSVDVAEFGNIHGC